MATGLLDGTYCKGVLPRVLEGCAGLHAVAERVGAQPRVVAWNERAAQPLETAPPRAGRPQPTFLPSRDPNPRTVACEASEAE